MDALQKSAKDAGRIASDSFNNMPHALAEHTTHADKFSKLVSETYRRNTNNYRELWAFVDELARRLQPTLSIGDDMLSSMRRDLLKQSRTTIFNWKIRTDKKTLAYAWFYKQLLDHGVEVRDDLLPDFPSRVVRATRLKLEKRMRQKPAAGQERFVKTGKAKKPPALSNVGDFIFIKN